MNRKKKAIKNNVRLSENKHISIIDSIIVNADNAIRNILKYFGFSLINLRIYAYASL